MEFVASLLQGNVPKVKIAPTNMKNQTKVLRTTPPREETLLEENGPNHRAL
jgi:hypothetical protein